MAEELFRARSPAVRVRTVKRTYVAHEDKLDGEWLYATEIVARFSAIDWFVAAMSDVILYFGLQKKESAMLLPQIAMMPASMVSQACRRDQA
jgi:hypothetical protein